MRWLVRVVHPKKIADLGAEHKTDGKYDVCFNEVFEGDTPREVRKVARLKYPLRKGWRLGFTKKIK